MKTKTKLLYPNQYKALERYGNTVISEKKYAEYGIKAIKEDIKKELGFDVTIEIVDNSNYFNGAAFFTNTPQRTIIIKKEANANVI